MSQSPNSVADSARSLSKSSDKNSFYRKLSEMCEKLHAFKTQQDQLFLKQGATQVHENPNYLQTMHDERELLLRLQSQKTLHAPLSKLHAKQLSNERRLTSIGGTKLISPGRKGE